MGMATTKARAKTKKKTKSAVTRKNAAPPSGLTSQREILTYFRQRQAAGDTVVTFVGYSGTGYEDRKHLRRCILDVLKRFDPDRTIVNVGVTPDGIGRVYELAKKKGFTTTGIVSKLAGDYGADVSPFVDHAFFVRDKTWGGYTDDGRLSPTSRLMVTVSDHMVAIGGGDVARDEMIEAEKKIPVEFFAADMNHRKAIEKAKKKGQRKPTKASLKGAVHEVFHRRR